MKKLIAAGCAMLTTYLVVPVFAQDSPEQIIQVTADAAQQVQLAKVTPEHRWQKFLASKKWDANLNKGGVIVIPDRELIISSASDFTRVSIGQPGWIESRIVAFERAEMEAKAKIIRYLEESVTTKRLFSLLENAAWSDGEINKVKELAEARDTLERLGKKSLALAEKSLDAVIAKLDPDYDPSQYEGKSPDELKVIAEDLFRRKVKSIAMRALIGVTPLYATEGEEEGAYQVLVGVIWSPKLNRLAMSLLNDEYSIQPVKRGKPLSEAIPADQLALLSTIGTRIVIDEHGDYVVMAYGQAQPRRTSHHRIPVALHQAKQIAANRARAAMINFIKEGLALRNEEISRELSQEFSDMTVGTETIRKYETSIKGKRIQVKLHGLRVLKEWDLKHPVTGQKVAGAVVAWSPASSSLSKRADAMMKAKPKSSTSKQEKNIGSVSSKPVVDPIETMPVDTSQY